jgi:cysteine desulfurase/selenocysteine lyase
MEKMVKSVKAVNKNIIIIVDATQAIPTQKIDVVKFDVDFLICSAHKMCGPTGIGLLYGKFKLLDKFISPLRLGGGMNGDVSETDYSLVSLPDRLEGGTLHGAGIFGFYEATQYLQKVGIDKITKYLADLKKYIDQQFKTIPNIQYFQTNSKHPICAFNIKGINPQDLANYLGKNKIIVRAGMSCVKLQNYITNTPAGAVRASFYFYNTKADVDALVNTLKKFKKTIILKNLI